MTTELTVSITLASDDPQEVVRFEDTLRDWLDRQPAVAGMAIADRGNDAAAETIWRAARKATFGPALRNPFAP
ncbi:hypothetical protein [Azospirillum picis]|uniref:Uncharacterized protein n=1 Tax=Azospirillum picis TaxID=488438 RepID=A0ABU0MKP0_9PROT|nr:hypothetical protein [Azospirillum picis]MBP2300121.1 hypothetical protein [Azospirillum picis]MDQ0534037.1 hypothetical protein [Azospirillum picis]